MQKAIGEYFLQVLSEVRPSLSWTHTKSDDDQHYYEAKVGVEKCVEFIYDALYPCIVFMNIGTKHTDTPLKVWDSSKWLVVDLSNHELLIKHLQGELENFLNAAEASGL